MDAWESWLKNLVQNGEAAASKLGNSFAGISFDKDLNLSIGGTLLPKFSWEWFAASLGLGIFESIGASLFSEFVGALFGGDSIVAILQNEMQAFAKIVQQELKQNDLFIYNSKLDSVRTMMVEYFNDPAQEFRLQQATLDSGEIVSVMKNLDLLGYPGFLSAASVRLSILQERTRIYPVEAADILTAKKEYVDHHNSVEADIAEKCSREYQLKQYIAKYPHVRPDLGTGRAPPPIVVEDVYGQNVAGQIIKKVNWLQIRKNIQEESTLTGQKIMLLWGAHQATIGEVLQVVQATGKYPAEPYFII